MTKETEIDELLSTAVDAGLDGLDFAAQFDGEEMVRIYNGIGPELFGKDCRDALSRYLALFAPAALIHDLRYSRSDGGTFNWHYANAEFRDNCLKLADWKYGWWNWRRYRARAVAILAFEGVEGPVGWIAWLKARQETLSN